MPPTPNGLYAVPRPRLPLRRCVRRTGAGFTLWGAFKSDVAFTATRWYPTLPLRVGNVSSAFGSIWRYLLNTVFVAGVGTAACC
ncbi:hypothetical protein [Cohnella sp. GbtcB17]|uniref:hypothetical protein n=1 Tax=Cohnella sp. GbtcB17 TaxID=2824762 RepID=UPI001C2F19C6|nr:hypothetical protein [Cohnella sp. GbtcB17]